MYKSKKVSAILLAGGVGVRFGADKNKVYVEVGDRPVTQYSLQVFFSHIWIDECVFVVRKGEEEIAKEIVEEVQRITGDTVSVVYCLGGESRQESVYNGLQHATGDIVVIHDGARPVIRPQYITRCVQAMECVSAASIAVKSKDTIKLTDDNGMVLHTTARANTWVVQTPQCFHKDVLMEAHEKFKDAEGITDDCSIMELAGEEVQLLEGDYTNIKITTPEDWTLADAFLATKD